MGVYYANLSIVQFRAMMLGRSCRELLVLGPNEEK